MKAYFYFPFKNASSPTQVHETSATYKKPHEIDDSYINIHPDYSYSRSRDPYCAHLYIKKTELPEFEKFALKSNISNSHMATYYPESIQKNRNLLAGFACKVADMVGIRDTRGFFCDKAPKVIEIDWNKEGFPSIQRKENLVTGKIETA